MMLTALAPVALAPAFDPIPTAVDDGPPMAAYREQGLPRSVAFFGPGPKPEFKRRGVRVVPAQGGQGWFVFIDERPVEQLDAIDRFLEGHRDPQTWELFMQAIEPRA